MSTAAHPNTPYRKGLAAARTYWETLEAWRAAGGMKSGPRPAIPECPYQRSQLRARRAWQAGIDWVAREVEQKARCGGKAPSWGRP